MWFNLGCQVAKVNLIGAGKGFYIGKLGSRARRITSLFLLFFSFLFLFFLLFDPYETEKFI
jgi:hypothetical protein